MKKLDITIDLSKECKKDPIDQINKALKKIRKPTLWQRIKNWFIELYRACKANL